MEYIPNHDNFNVFIAKNNNITEAPLKGYEKLKNLFLLNLTENPIKKFNLDVALDMYKEGDGSLVMLSISTDKLSDEGKQEFQKFLEMTKGDMI